VELIGALDHRRLRRELQRREEALRGAARAREAVQASEISEPEPALPVADQATPEWLAAPSSSAPRNPCECDFCGRSFYGYAQFLNHKCHQRD
jgi:hypothetical protein